MKTIEDLITRLKSLQVSSSVWKWETTNAAEVDACKNLALDIERELDLLIMNSIGAVGRKEGGFQLSYFEYISLEEIDLDSIIDDLKDFILEVIRNPNGAFSPEIEKRVVNIVSALYVFRYSMTLE